MKKIITFILAISIILSAFSGLTVFAEEEYKILFFDDFNDNLTDLPMNWTYNTAYTASHTYLQSKVSKSGKALRIEDDSTTQMISYTSPRIKITGDSFYTASADMYRESGSFYISFNIMDENGNSLAQKTEYINVDNQWHEVYNALYAPEGAAYCMIGLCVNPKDLAKGYYDNITLSKGVKWTVKSTELYPAKQADPVNAKIIEPQGDKLVYNTYNEYGDKLSDFSYAGFYQGEYEIPDSSKIDVVATIEPSKDPNADDTERIQKVIDDVYDNSPNDYFKVIKMKAGRYNINKNGLTVRSGIILSGEGQGPTGTIIFASDKEQYTPLKIAGTPPMEIGDTHYLTDSYIKAGSYEINLSPEDVKNYKVGDLILFNYDSTDEWCEAMEMKGIKNVFGNDHSWGPGAADVKDEKYITAINGNTLTLDMPFYIPYDSQYSKPYIYKIDDSGKTIHAGIENLRLESTFNGTQKDENHASRAVSITNAKNCYVRDISTKYFIHGGVECLSGAKQITVKNCSCLEPVSTIDGSRRYSFSYGYRAQQCLVSGCYAYYGRHSYTTSMPNECNVFLDSVVDSSEGNADAHGNWAIGTLYDNIYSVIEGSGGIDVSNHAIYGEFYSHGWPGGGIVVVWNPLVPYTLMQKPPLTYNNFLIGEWGYYDTDANTYLKQKYIKDYKDKYLTSKQVGGPEEKFDTKEGTSFIGDAYKESEFAPVEPRSLYKAQMAEKLTGSYKNVKPNAPMILSPRGEEEHKVDNNFTIEGIFQKGAEKVTIYIDNQAYDAALNNENYTFSLPVELKNGTHKVYATQTIDGLESTKCADRFVVVNRVGTSNPDYLQSQYEYDKIHATINDNVISFDEYQKPYEKLLPEKITVKIGESMLVTDVDPVEINGRVLVPMRAIFETFEADVSWDEATKTATSVRGNTVIKVTENNQIANVNGEEKWLDVPATIINGRFVVPVRFIAETFGADVGWIDLKRQVTIKGAAPIYISEHGFENEINIYGIEQSGANDYGNVIDYVVDGNTETHWTVSSLNENGGAWGIFDFGFARNIKEMHIAFISGTTRVHTFDIYVSDDGENFTLVKENLASSGKTLDYQKFEIGARGQYVKIVGKGNNVAGKEEWNNYAEMVFIQEK